jgi:integrase
MDRKIPIVDIPARPYTTDRYKVIRALRKATEGMTWETSGYSIHSHDFRHCYGHWLEAAGIPRSRVSAYMGHETKDGGSEITGLYQAHRVDPYLEQDAARIRAYLKGARKAQKLTKVDRSPLGLVAA